MPKLSTKNMREATEAVSNVLADDIVKAHSNDIGMGWQKLAFVSLTLAACELLQSVATWFYARSR